jgi:Ca2+-binding EF-hand superfamily protein
MLKVVGFDYNEDQIDEIFSLIDTNKDNKISYEELTTKILGNDQDVKISKVLVRIRREILA